MALEDLLARCNAEPEPQPEVETPQNPTKHPWGCDLGNHNPLETLEIDGAETPETPKPRKNNNVPGNRANHSVGQVLTFTDWNGRRTRCRVEKDFGPYCRVEWLENPSHCEERAGMSGLVNWMHLEQSHDA